MKGFRSREFHCMECGSMDVEMKVWVDINGLWNGKYAEVEGENGTPVELPDDYSGDCFCNNCQDHQEIKMSAYMKESKQ
tara:strand:+ start:137 stop:373 length:237 start_codon:yes stop_codon:yes gene_type:complete